MLLWTLNFIAAALIEPWDNLSIFIAETVIGR